MMRLHRSFVVMSFLCAGILPACLAQDRPPTEISVPIGTDTSDTNGGNGNQSSSNGSQPRSNGNQPSGNGNQPSSNGNQPSGNGNQPSSNGNQPSGNSNQPSGASTSRPICSGLGTWDPQAAKFEAEVLELVNAARAKGATCGGEAKPAVPALRSDAKLDCVARSYAKAMAEQDFFSHTGLDGSSPFDRMKTAYPSYRSAGENIAAGQRSAKDVMEGWLKSSGHCENIMGNYTLLGVGMYNNVWVQNFVRL